MEMTTLYNQWNFGTNTLGNGTTAGLNGIYRPANYRHEVILLPEPAERASRRPGYSGGDSTRCSRAPARLAAAGCTGGTDYGGCAGRVVPGWDPDNTHAFLDRLCPRRAAKTIMQQAVPTSDPSCPFYNGTTTGHASPLATNRIQDNDQDRGGLAFSSSPTRALIPPPSAMACRIRLCSANCSGLSQATSTTGVTPADRWSQPRRLGSRRRCHVAFSTAISNPLEQHGHATGRYRSP